MPSDFSMPRVTAIITTFNRADYLKRAVESVLSQTLGEFELLILDNSSTDGSATVVGSFADKRMRYIRHEPLNISQARNLAVREARGEFIAFLDDDDIWLPDKLEKQLAVFDAAAHDTALVYGGFFWVGESGKELYCHKPALRGMVLEQLLRQVDFFTGAASNPMLRKAAVTALGGYNEQVKTGEDWELYLRLAEKYPVDFTPEPVVRIRCHQGPRLGDKLDEAAKLDMLILDRYGYIFDRDRKLKSRYLQKIGGKFTRVGDSRMGRRYMVEALRTCPANTSAYLQLACSLLGRRIYRRIHDMYIGSVQ